MAARASQGLLTAIDTNVLLRLLLRDDPEQCARADEVLAGGIFVSTTVLLESVWVLQSRFNLERGSICDALFLIFDTDGVTVQNRAAVIWALERFRAGADFADALHVVEATGQRGFATFDRDLERRLAATAPVPIELLTAKPNS